ncbi:MAG: pyridoxamine 5'-phosphate oxidase family protein [Acidimicrobiales bacterium]
MVAHPAPLWTWDGEALTGIIATGPTPIKRAHLEAPPYVSCTYWAPSHDTCTAECAADWAFDDASCVAAWEALKTAPAPVDDPAIIPPWADSPASDAFAVLRLTPWRLGVPQDRAAGRGAARVLTWSA